MLQGGVVQGDRKVLSTTRQSLPPPLGAEARLLINITPRWEAASGNIAAASEQAGTQEEGGRRTKA